MAAIKNLVVNFGLAPASGFDGTTITVAQVKGPAVPLKNDDGSPSGVSVAIYHPGASVDNGTYNVTSAGVSTGVPAYDGTVYNDAVAMESLFCDMRVQGFDLVISGLAPLTAYSLTAIGTRGATGTRTTEISDGATTVAYNATAVPPTPATGTFTADAAGQIALTVRNPAAVMNTYAYLGAMQITPDLRLAVHIDADIDTVGERDDIAAAALWFATQDHFNIVGLTTSAPDSDRQEWLNCIAAYGSDRQAILDAGKSADDFKTAGALTSLVVQGVKTDNPSRGYWNSGESGYAAAHAAAQLLISNAVTYGSATGRPNQKLWVVIQGGYTTLAQALHEAITLGQLPDILDRIRVVGQPNWNSSWAPNAWNYIFGHCWPTAGTPGIFGDLWMLSGYFQWHAFNRDNGGTDTTFWNNITANSAMGAHLRSTLTRSGGAFTTPHFRAGDAGAWFWLLSAKLQDNYSPTNAANWCGKYRTYEGVNPWPSQTIGYGAESGLGTVPNPEGVTYSPTHWAPEITVDSYADAYAAVDLAQWYSLVPQVMALYQVVPEPVPSGMIGEWLFTEGTGTTVADNSGNGLTANFGFSSATESGAEPSWVAEGLDFTPSQIVTVDDNAAIEAENLTIVAVVNPDTLTGDKVIVARSGVESPAAPGVNDFQFRIKDGNLQFLGFNVSTVTVAGGAISAGAWSLVTAQNVGTAAVIRKGGTQTGSGTFAAALSTTTTAQLRMGARKNANVSTTLPADGFDGRIAYVAMYQGLTGADLATVEQRARDAVALKGITI